MADTTGPTPEQVGGFLRYYRRRIEVEGRTLTIAAAAESCGVSVRSWSSWEAGAGMPRGLGLPADSELPSAQRWRRIATELQIPEEAVRDLRAGIWTAPPTPGECWRTINPWSCGDVPCGATSATECDHVPCGRSSR